MRQEENTDADGSKVQIMPGELSELSLAIGRLQADVKNLSESLKEEREGAAQHRRDLREVIASLSGSVRILADQVSEMKPFVSEYRDQREQAKGAAKYRAWIWGTMALIAGWFVSVFFDLVKLLGIKIPPGH